MRLERVPTEAGAILYDPSRIDHPQAADFDPVALSRSGRVVGTASGRGQVVFVAPREAPGPAMVLRHYRRGGLVARLVRDCYLWRGAEATRCFRELRLLAQLEARGLPAARPVAAHYVRTGLCYRADLLTVAIPATLPLAAALAGGLPADSWRRIGATIRSLHDAGVHHADLNAHNILIDAAGEVHLIDFDRGTEASPGRWRERSIARLQRSLVKLGALGPQPDAAPEWQRLLDGYRAPRSAPPR